MPLNSKKEVEEMEKSNKETKKIKRETQVPANLKAPKIKKQPPSESEVLAVMEVGVLYTSTQLADKLGLTGETRRDTVRRIMAKLATDKKVKITEQEGKRSKFLYELAEK